MSETQLQVLQEALDRYINRVASLSEELDNLRRSICLDCKKRFIPSYIPVDSPSDGCHLPLSCADSALTPSSGLPPDSTANAGGPPDTSDLFVSGVQLEQPEPTPVLHNQEIKQTLHIDLAQTFKFRAKVYCIKFSPDGKYLAVGLDKGGRTYIYDVEKGLNVCSFVDLNLKPEDQPTIWCVQFSPDNKYIATACSDKPIRLWEVARKRTRATFASHRKSVTTLYFSPNNRFLVAGDGHGGVRIWSIRDGSSRELTNDAKNILSVTFSPDGRHIASVDVRGWLRIWDARSLQLVDTWEGHTQHALCVAFCPDGKGLVSGGGDAILRYWDVSSLAVMKTGRGRVIDGIPGQRFHQIRTFEGHKALIRSVSFSPDCSWVATGSRDKMLRIWDPYTAKWQCTLLGHTSYVRTVDFSPAGKYLASGGKDSQVKLWRYREV